MNAIVPVILAGGSGTRLWPVSRETMPKQLAALIGERSLLQQTVQRLLAPGTRPLITVGAKAQDAIVAAQLAAIDPAAARHRLLEPTGRNTAAAIALAALYARARIAPDALLWVCPSDHLIRAPAALDAAVAQAAPVAAAGALITFGITPTRPETGYGYIRAGEPLASAAGVLAVERFIEKPPLGSARAMLAEGGYWWNSGMFLFRADRILEELRAHAGALLAAVEQAYAGLAELPGGAFEVPLAAYEAVPAAPIDKAVMERSRRIAVVPCDPGWSDLGSWQAVWEELAKDEAGNAARGDVQLAGSSNCLVHAEHRLVACTDVHDLAVIETADAVLVAPRAAGEPVKAMVDQLKAAGRSEATAHAAEQRPWGSFQVLHEAPSYKVKEIIVTPGGRLSLQSHRHRAEHWTVVAGTARVTVDDQILTLAPNQSVHIPLGARHRMENPGPVPMHLIEVQCGTYLGEDDIIRYDDAYGRN